MGNIHITFFSRKIFMYVYVGAIYMDGMVESDIYESAASIWSSLVVTQHVSNNIDSSYLYWSSSREPLHLNP